MTPHASSLVTNSIRRRMSSGTFGRPSGSRSYALWGLSAATRSGLLKIITTPPSIRPAPHAHRVRVLRRPRRVAVPFDRTEIKANAQPGRIRDGEHAIRVELPGLSHDGVDIGR